MVEVPRDTMPRFWPLFAVALGVRFTVVLLGLGIAANRPDAGPPHEPAISQYAEIDARAAWPLEPWYRADALWILHISTHGYSDSAGPHGQHGAAFLPALPAALAFAALLGLNVYWVGVMIPNLAAAAGMAIFTRLAFRLTGDRATAIRAFVLLNAFPSALFLSAPYQEALGLLFTALALSCWQSGRVGLAAMFAGIGCVARVTGVALGAAALGAWLFERPRTRTGLLRALIMVAGCAIGILIGWAVLWVTVGDPFLGMKSHEAWGRRSPSVWNLALAVRSIYNPAERRILEGSLALLFVVLGIRGWWKRGAFWGLVILLPILQMTSTGTFLSGHRVLLACLPGFIELADLLRNRMAFLTTVTLSAVVQLFLLDAYIHWGFAG
jgi:hypothetical protein